MQRNLDGLAIVTYLAMRQLRAATEQRVLWLFPLAQFTPIMEACGW